ncbi:hypothetical protein [Metabacillus litoralis]|uniref:hypothetical protein n=1 Tax=Metabacillus litoralis TaxID=152268 RepID=UPI001CFE38A0|nr:hypothetical protein [Metabacillus litoralis]
MKKYLFFMMLFGLFFPVCQKLAMIIIFIINHHSKSHHNHIVILASLDSMINLFISAIAAFLAFFFTQVFLKWEAQKK